MTNLPDYYFRVRENGALVFRLDPDTRLRRIDLEQIATLNMKNGEVKPHGERKLTATDQAAIRDWMPRSGWAATAAPGDLDDIFRAIDHLNLTAQWAQSRATPEDLAQVSDALLLAMHDLRSVLVRKKADQVGQKPD
jgi:hypothetical protein